MKHISMRTSFLILGACLILAGIFFVSEQKTHFVAKTYSDLVLDNKEYYLACDELPTLDAVSTTVHAHADMVDRIIRETGKTNREYDVTPLWQENMVSDGETFTVVFSWGEPEHCQGTGKGEILISYPSHDNRTSIEQTINSDTFFGAPYRLRNV